ncbi:MAG TPA: hypothetical protein VL728_09490 [Cyclobacteriaceae bacterium]|nr:hypothetical protein [Cyclobacteriaceae bacterium]
MKKILPGLFLLICISCNESGVKLAKPSTFVHYFNGGTPDFSQAIIKTKSALGSGTPVGGYLILANSQTALTSTYYRIKLIRVDEYGNEQWQSLLPVPQKDAPSYRGFGITPITDNSGLDIGYFMVGEEIYVDPANNNTRTQGLLMIQVDTKGVLVKTATLAATDIGVNDVGAQISGVGVTQAKNGNFYVLGELQGSVAGDMLLAEIDANNLTKVWSRTFGAAATTLVNKVFTYGDSIYWGGTRTAGTSQEMRWISTQINSGSKSDNPYPSGQAYSLSNQPINYTCSDICKYGFGYGFVGSYSLSPGVFSRIAFFRVNESGQQVDSVSYALPYPQQAPYQAGNSICSTNDGGFLILGTAATDISTSDTNYILIKTDAHGTQQWRKDYGGKFIDVGVKVLQADDGGFIILGTTTLANVESVFLMKTDSDGNIQ